MDPEPTRTYNVDADLSKILEKAGGTGDKAEAALLDESAVEKLATINARLDNEAGKALPENPWYLVILVAVLIGVLVGLLFLLK